MSCEKPDCEVCHGRSTIEIIEPIVQDLKQALAKQSNAAFARGNMNEASLLANAPLLVAAIAKLAGEFIATAPDTATRAEALVNFTQMTTAAFRDAVRARGEEPGIDVRITHEQKNPGDEEDHGLGKDAFGLKLRMPTTVH